MGIESDEIESDEAAPPEADVATDGEENADADAEPTPKRDFFDHWIFGDDPLWGVVGVAITVFAMLYYFLHFGHLTAEVNSGYGDSAFDVGLYDQGLWLLSRFHAPYVTTMGRDLFGDHAQFSLIALVPLYWLGAGATTLFYVQSFLMALGAVPVYMLAMRRLNNPVFATVLALAFLLHPALGQTNLENYHPDSFLVPIMGFLIYAAIQNKPRMLVVFTILALLCKEDVVLILLPLLLWYAWRRNSKLGLWLAGASVATAAFMTYVVMRSFIGVPTLNTWRIPTFDECKTGCQGLVGQVGGLVRATVKKPADVVKYVIKGDSPNGRPFYAWQMVAPTGLMFLIAPEVAATMLLVLGENVMSTFGYQHQIAYHYSMVILPTLWMGTVYAISKLKTEKLRTIAICIVGVSALWTSFLWGALPWNSTVGHWSPSSPQVEQINKVKDQVPPNATIAVDYAYATHLDHRKRIYMWPTPFHAVYWNTFRQEGKCLPIANDVQYVMLPKPLSDSPQVWNAMKDHFQVVTESDDAALYKRSDPSTDICDALVNANVSTR